MSAGRGSRVELKRAEPTTILLCRHGETDWNLEKRFQGRVDTPLNSAGEQQACQVAEALKKYNVAAVWTSPARRALQTAAKVVKETGAKLFTDKRLIERQLGLMEGLTSDEVKQRHSLWWEAWANTGKEFPPEAEVEPSQTAVARIESALFDIASAYAGKTVAVISHGALIRVLLNQAMGTAAITTLIVGPGRSWRLIKANDSSHLRGLRGFGFFQDAEGGALEATSTVILCRHGETDWNLARKFQGMENIPLNSVGVDQALLLADALKDHQLSAVWSSPLLRARETSVAIAAAAGLRLHTDDRLRERHLGVFQGRTPAMMDKEYPAVIEAWREQVPLPSEAEAEPSEEVVARLESVLRDVATAYPGKKVALVLHGAAIRCLLKRAVGQVRIETPKNVSLTMLSVRPSGKWRLLQVADSSHTPAEPLPAKL